jgi:hypothetical protein
VPDPGCDALRVAIEVNRKGYVAPYSDALIMPDTKHVFEGGHFLPRPEMVSETLAWLDRHLGPVVP